MTDPLPPLLPLPRYGLVPVHFGTLQHVLGLAPNVEIIDAFRDPMRDHKDLVMLKVRSPDHSALRPSMPLHTYMVVNLEDVQQLGPDQAPDDQVTTQEEPQTEYNPHG